MKIVSGSLLLIVLTLAWSGYLARHPAATHPERVGRAVPCEGGSLFNGEQAQVLEYGLRDARGLAVFENHIFMADKDRPILVFDPHSKDILIQPGVDCDHGCQTSEAGICPDGRCAEIDIRGLAILPNVKGEPSNSAQLMIADHGNAGILRTRLITKNSELSSIPDLERITSPEGIWMGVDFMLVTNDMSLQEIGNSGKADNKPKGSLLELSLSDFASKNKKIGIRQLIGGLISPSGLAAESDTGPVYVAERFPTSVAWGVYRSRKSGNSKELEWYRDRYLASVPNEGVSLPSYVGVAIWSTPPNTRGEAERVVILAAGPHGLYAFDRNGRQVGRMDFEDPVRGVAVANDAVYLAVGSLLCRIPLLSANLLSTDVDPGAGSTEPSYTEPAHKPIQKRSPRHCAR